MKLILASALFVSIASTAVLAQSPAAASKERPNLPYQGPRVGPLVSQNADKNQAHIDMHEGAYDAALQKPGWTEHLTLPHVDANNNPIFDAQGNPMLYTYYSNSGELLFRIVSMLTGYSG